MDNEQAATSRPLKAEVTGSILRLARKVERAMRNETGVKLTLEELIACAELGFVDTLQKKGMRSYWAVLRELSPYVVGACWLGKRRDGKLWQIITYDARSRQGVYRSTHCKGIARCGPACCHCNFY